VQLIDAGELYRKLRKNLGNKNCEFAPAHIREIVSTYESMAVLEEKEVMVENIKGKISAQVFDNSDFGYYKVTIERPKRLKAQFTAERIAELRFDKTLREPMIWAYETFGEKVYSDIAKHEKEITDWCEKNELNLNPNKVKP
jgi:type I restriction enzyme M protein